MDTFTSVKKAKLNVQDYTSWGVEKYGYELYVNPPSMFAFEIGRCVIDVENYKDGRFAGIGILIPGEKTLLFYTDEKLAKESLVFKGQLIGHVLRTDLHKLVKWGFDIDSNRVHYDTALIEHLQNSTKRMYGLKELVKEKFKIEYPSYQEIVGEGDFDNVPPAVVANYNGMDLIATYKLLESQDQTLADAPIYKNLLWPLGLTLNSMEERGIALDLPHLRRLETEFSAQRADIVKTLTNELGDVNLNSPKQLLEALHAKGIKPTYKGKASTDKRGLARLQRSPVVDGLLQYSGVDTLLNSFITPYLEAKTEVITPFFSQTATRTGRLACYRPNLQQIPTHTENGRMVKEAFVARPGYSLAELDYSAIEPRILAHFSKSKALCELFTAGTNFHDFTSERLGIERQTAKVLNLSTGYRATKYGIAYQLKCSVEQAEKQLDEWWGLWPDLYLWESNLIAATTQSGYITTLLGRKIYIDNLDSKEQKIRDAAERRVIENLAQSSVSDIIGLAMIELYKSGLLLINQVHDSVLLEVKEAELETTIHKARTIMEAVVKLNVPTVVDVKVGDNWGRMEKYVFRNV